jgi:hypothetical protein
MRGIKHIQLEPSMMNCYCEGVRKILTKQKIEKLKQYQKDLEQELIAVKETLQSLMQNN